jgi:hypothetical protein
MWTQRFIRFQMTKARFYVPLGWAEWSVACRISLPQDKTSPQLHLYNDRMTWQITDRWPTEGREYQDKGGGDEDEGSGDEDEGGQ